MAENFFWQQIGEWSAFTSSFSCCEHCHLVCPLRALVSQFQCYFFLKKCIFKFWNFSGLVKMTFRLVDVSYKPKLFALCYSCIIKMRYTLFITKQQFSSPHCMVSTCIYSFGVGITYNILIIISEFSQFSQFLSIKYNVHACSVCH